MQRPQFYFIARLIFKKIFKNNIDWKFAMQIFDHANRFARFKRQ